MSWQAYADGLIEYSDSNTGHSFKNVCTSGGVYGHDGSPWGQKLMSLKKEDIDKLIKLCKEDSFNESVNINGQKYMPINHEVEKKTVILKIKGGGATARLTNQTLVVATFETAKKMKKDDKEKDQNPGDCTGAVDYWADYLEQSGY